MSARRMILLLTVVSMISALGWSVSAGEVRAAPVVTLGGGAGLLIGGGRSAELCTLNSIGRDRRGALVGLTAGHCGSPGESVRAERSLGAGILGTVTSSVRTGDPAWVAGLDYAVIRFDATRIRASATYGGTIIVGAGADPAPGASACKSGRTTGFSCGPVLARLSPTSVIIATCAQPGDSGGPIVVNNRVVGLLRGSIVYGAAGGGGYPACSSRADAARTPAAGTSIGAVIADLNRRGGIGAGYRPV